MQRCMGILDMNSDGTSSMKVLRTKHWLLIASAGLILVLGLALFIMPGPGTTYAKPTLEVKNLATTFGVDCTPQAELEWTGSQFAKTDGFRQVLLYKDGAVVFNGTPFRITAGTDGESGMVLSVPWENDLTAEYRFEVSFYRANGENGATIDNLGRLLMTYPGPTNSC